MAITYGESWVELCNRARGKLGAGSIANLNEGSKLANYCGLYLGDAISTVLGGYDWRALRTRLQLAASVTVPAYGYNYEYNLPADFERLIEVENGGYDYSVENGKILTDADEVYITYVARPTNDPAKLPDTLKRALTSELAVALSLPLTSGDALYQRLLIERDRDLQRAREADARTTEDMLGAEERGYTYYDELR